MKKLILITILILSIGMYKANAQYAFGVKVTPMASWLNVTPTTNSVFTFENGGTLPAIGFGPSLKKYLGESFNVDLAAVFVWQDSKFTATPTGSIGQIMQVENKLKYLQIPLIFEGSFGITDKLRGSIDFGGTSAIKLAADIKYYDKDHNAITNLTPAKTSIFNFYLNAGAGISYDVTDELMVSGTVMYNHDIIDIWFDDKDSDHINELKMLNHSISLNLGLYIKF